jgi:hypothetical protein
MIALPLLAYNQFMEAMERDSLLIEYPQKPSVSLFSSYPFCSIRSVTLGEIHRIAMRDNYLRGQF